MVAKKYLENVLITPTIEYISTNYDFPLMSSQEYQELITDLSADDARNQLIADTYKSKFKGKHIVILCMRVSQVVSLQKKLGKGALILHSGMTKKARREVMNQLKSGKKKIIISTYGLFSTGIDIPELEVLFMAAPIKSEVKVRQSAGRLMRMAKGKTTATIVDFVDENIDLLKYQSYTRKRIYKKL